MSRNITWNWRKYYVYKISSELLKNLWGEEKKQISGFLSGCYRKFYTSCLRILQNTVTKILPKKGDTVESCNYRTDSLQLHASKVHILRIKTNQVKKEDKAEYWRQLFFPTMCDRSTWSTTLALRVKM